MEMMRQIVPTPILWEYYTRASRRSRCVDHTHHVCFGTAPFGCSFLLSSRSEERGIVCSREAVCFRTTTDAVSSNCRSRCALDRNCCEVAKIRSTRSNVNGNMCAVFVISKSESDTVGLCVCCVFSLKAELAPHAAVHHQRFADEN